MEKVTQKQWQEAHETISRAKKESAQEKAESMKNFINQRDRTYWKESTDYYTRYLSINIDPDNAHYATVFIFEVHTNGRNEIKSKLFSKNELTEFLKGASEESIERQREKEYCDCECECSCYEEIELPKTNIKHISEDVFKKHVQEKILDNWSIGLKFK